MSWIRYQLGPAAMTRYFSTNRPVWGMLYQLTTSVLPQIPDLLGDICPGACDGYRPYWCGCIATQPVARTAPSSPPLRVWRFCCILVSTSSGPRTCTATSSSCCASCCSPSCVRSGRSNRPDRRVPLTAGGMLLAGLNLWMMEYFFFLELSAPAAHTPDGPHNPAGHFPAAGPLGGPSQAGGRTLSFSPPTCFGGSWFSTTRSTNRRLALSVRSNAWTALRRCCRRRVGQQLSQNDGRRVEPDRSLPKCCPRWPSHHGVTTLPWLFWWQ